jgi:DNA polymerase III epsilon subunit-like protein
VSTTTAAVTEQIPSSRTEPDPDRVAKGKPLTHIAGVPVYGWGQAPPYLRTKTQLLHERRKLTEEQAEAPLAYVRTRDYGDVPLYDPKGAARMRRLAPGTKARMTGRRTCGECGKVRKEILRGRPCTPCRERARKEEIRLRARTCQGCETVRERPYPKAHRRCPDCRSEQLAMKRSRVAAWLVEVTVCAADDCTAKIGSKAAARAYLKEHDWLLSPERTDLPDSMWWPAWPRRCPPCKEAYDAEQERQRAEYQARYEQGEKERAERGRRKAEDRQRWAAAALVDSDVLVLDSETTGLDDDARIVELAVLTSRGEVLLDTLLDPGVPVPDDAAELHGITTEALAGAPTFSDVLVQLTGLLDGKRCLIYNKWYDIGRLRRELTLHYLDRSPVEATEEESAAWAREQAEAWLDVMTFEDVMIPYSDWVGDYSEYHGNNRWQALDGGHRAAEDCHAVLGCLRVMGRKYADEYATAAAVADGTSEGTN